MASSPTEPMAFLSYVRFADAHEDGRLSQWRERLSGEVRLQTGDPFPIFQDRQDIAWGQQWQQRIHGSIDAATFLIPVITPGFFKSQPCRDELERFLDRERALGRTDLVMPLYYVGCRVIDDDAARAQDPLARAIATRQFADWRELRFESLTSPTAGRMLARMAGQIVQAMAASGPPAARPVDASVPSASQRSIARPPERAVAQEAPPPRRTDMAKTEPPTLIVDAMHRGHHATIGDALRAAQPGTRILVRPGLYREALVIDKPIELIGDGELGEAVIEANDADVVWFRAAMGRIAHLTLRQTGGKDYWYGVDIAQGRLDLEDCDITSKTGACVGIHDGADPRLRRNRIHDGLRSGVLIFNDGQGVLEDNDVFANAGSGVWVFTGGNPTLRRNRVQHNGYQGITVAADGNGTFEHNVVTDNKPSDWAIDSQAEPRVRRIDK